MANKRVTSLEDPLVQVTLRIKKSQKEYLEDLGKESASSFIRKILDDAISNHSAEISKLKEERTNHELQIKMIDAQLNELEETATKQQNAVENRERLVNKQISELVEILKRYGGIVSETEHAIKFRAEALNKLNGGGPQITFEDLKNAVIKAAIAQGVVLF